MGCDVRGGLMFGELMMRERLRVPEEQEIGRLLRFKTERRVGKDEGRRIEGQGVKVVVNGVEEKR
jgi:hypothetical protein